MTAKAQFHPEQKWWRSDTVAVVTGGVPLLDHARTHLHSCEVPVHAANHARQFVITERHANYIFPAANKGIGYGIAKLLAEQGLTTVVAARNG